MIQDVATIAFDTLKLARKLEAAGFGREQAIGAAEALAETIGEAVVTREYLDHRLSMTEASIAAVRSDLKARLAAVQAELEAKLAALHAELEGRLAAVQAGLEGRLATVQAGLEGKLTTVQADLRAHIADTRPELLKWVIGLLLAQTAIIAALVKLL